MVKENGKLFIMGIGAGETGWRTMQLINATQQTDVFVGYQLYLDLISDLIGDKQTLNSDLGHEKDRALKAIEVAATGKNVSLVCSGDAGIYGLSTLVFEILDNNKDRRDFMGIDIEIIPGISAFQALASKTGAIFNHDFCLMSLSDLLTPKESIYKRLDAVAEGDFVVAFYNPKSLKRVTILDEAINTIKQKRHDDTPVIIGRNIGREDESITIVPISKFDSSIVDMLTLVIVGNSETKIIDTGNAKYTYTPRGYAKKGI